jgi:hypothetical protein
MGMPKDKGVLIACIGATSAIVAAFAKPICAVLFEDDDKPRAAAVAADNNRPLTTPLADSGRAALNGDEPITPTPSAPSIEGAWKQYVLVDGTEPVYLGTFVVSRYKGEWVISPRSQSEGANLVNTLGIFDVAYDGQHLSFNSNWGQDQGVGNFELARISPTVFEGEIRIAGQLSNRTRLVKIE